MRIQLGKSIYLCTKVTYTPNSRLLLFTTSNGIYTVDMTSCYNALYMYEMILKEGYCDLSNYEY